MPLQATSGAASYDAFGGGVAAVPNYIEEVFSTWLYTGNGATQTITNGIDLAGKGGLVWLKSRSGADTHELTNTIQGISNSLRSNSTNGASSTDLTGFTSSGFTLGYVTGNTNVSGANEVSWTFRKQPKFFDIVTYTGDGSAPRDIAHSLGSSPGCIIIKKTSSTGDWWVWHRATPNANANLYLNNTDAADTGANPMISGVSSTTFTLATNQNATMNASGATYVAYLFAHDAGGFGLTGTDNVISCGSFTAVNNNATVNLGWEPQWVLYKRTDSDGQWYVVDNMRGWSHSGSVTLYPNLSNAEAANSSGAGFITTATGFQGTGQFSNAPFIYIAIRRGPMKVPTDGTSVFSPFVGSDTSTITTGFPVDMLFDNKRAGNSNNTVNASRLTGDNSLVTSSTAAETAGLVGANCWQNNTGYLPNALGTGVVAYAYRRAPGFFDEVCYTGTGSTTAYSHNLGVAPELMIIKSRNDVNDWAVYSSALGNTKYLFLDTTAASATTYPLWASTTPSATTFTTNGTYNFVGGGGVTYVAYLFASCPGVSKVTNFTGNGTSQTINCGFTSGARFVMIKATSTTGNWTVFDSARGISAGGDPALYLNSTAAEVTGVDAIDADSTGFIVNQEGTFNLNASGVQYLVLAIS